VWVLRITASYFRLPPTELPSGMRSRQFPKPWSVEPIPSGYRVLDANGIVLAHVYAEPEGTIGHSDTRLTSDEARRISKLIARLPELVEVERDRNRAKSRRKPQTLRFKSVTIGDLIRAGKLLESTVPTAGRRGTSFSIPRSSECPGACQCSRWPAISSALSAVPEKETNNPIWARPAARVGGVGQCPEFSRSD
jgi:hypothetical protein